MLKKAGIVVAAAAAGLLSLSPLAFATTGHDHGGHHGDHSGPRPVNVDYTNVQHDNNTNDCNFAQDGGDARSTALGGSSLLGVLNPVISAAAPVTANLNALNCNNIDLSRLVNIGSENSSSTESDTRFVDSFNR
jgi:hypothetical protein